MLRSVVLPPSSESDIFYLSNKQHIYIAPALSTIHIAQAQNQGNINLHQNHIITGTHWQYIPDPTLGLIYEFQGDDDHHTINTLKASSGRIDSSNLDKPQ
jgi:hypothetical protein